MKKTSTLIMVLYRLWLIIPAILALSTIVVLRNASSRADAGKITFYLVPALYLVAWIVSHLALTLAKDKLTRYILISFTFFGATMGSVIFLNTAVLKTALICILAAMATGLHFIVAMLLAKRCGTWTFPFAKFARFLRSKMQTEEVAVIADGAEECKEDVTPLQILESTVCEPRASADNHVEKTEEAEDE